MNKQDSPIWLAIKRFFKRAWRVVKYVWYRLQLRRWLILGILLLVFFMSSYLTFKAKTANVGEIKANLQTSTTLYDKKDARAGTLYTQKGTYVELDKISPEIQNAVISTEDRSFYTNPGFSVKGLARAAVNLVIHHGQITGGGSTLTQQLAKNAKLSQKQTFSRKFEELFLAVQITKTYSKKDILAMYLNNAYFGNGVWGVQDASRRYFGKNASELDASEAAVIAAMLRSPSYYNPADHLDNATSRRNLILGLMVDNGKLTESQAKAAKSETLVVKNTLEQNDSYKYPYYFDEVVSEAVKRFGLKEEDLVKNGYKIYTALDQSQQSKMENTFEQNWLFPDNAADGTLVQGSSIAIDPKTGGVSAVVGGRGDYTIRGYSRITQMKRQPGSTIKPLAVYTPALEDGYHYDSSLQDKKKSYGTNKYTPTNPDNVYTGSMPMYQAVANSTNAPAVWLLNQIGLKRGIKSVEDFGISVPKSDQNLAMALGGWQGGVSPYQMASAYTAFANNGELSETHFIRKIVDASGAVIVDNTTPSKSRIMSKKTSKEMTSMMLGVYNSGTGRYAKPDGYQVAGKSGSTEVPDSYGYGTKDQWLIGYTPDIVVATWMGYDKTDQEHFMKNTSIDGLAPIFKYEMQQLLPTTAQTNFDTEDAQSMAKKEDDQDSDKVVNSLQSGIKDGVNKAKETVNQWYNNLKGFFN
ncbi:PBP1A family penicillin-binding protein [Latilactobacillus sakei]|uniref:PBP1A family penicillin-binding protein n=1 Tax=Latilactobacillus sakei TaxID=1599 RepID=UPI000505EBFD|nr:PBP1A family penicillin-binding protein [Latilactobacillus sakei]AST83167.1 carboxypeptidase [Latilactobacillus sakei]AWZ45900.1 carboxypeptidase [Latilactobacillus sakei]KGB14797.1 carboxypeptidase [Latilactobacillus sakei]MCP8855272.1 PBP1A family penicillin-binding protein [Latilactobacillus sakei]MDB1552523.1 PBP1A family penicillin-binding protein [Latilactobacillus sakei]